MDIIIWDGAKYNRQTYDKTLVELFKQKYWYLCTRSPYGSPCGTLMLLTIDDSQKAFTNFLNMKNN